MCQIVLAVGGPSTAELLRAIEWSGSSEQRMLYFDLGDTVVESFEYRVFMVTNSIFVISVLTMTGDELEIIWEPAKQRGRCLLAVSSL